MAGKNSATKLKAVPASATEGDERPPEPIENGWDKYMHIETPLLLVNPAASLRDLLRGIEIRAITLGDALDLVVDQDSCGGDQALSLQSDVSVIKALAYSARRCMGDKTGAGMPEEDDRG